MGIQGSRARRFVLLAATGALIVGAVAGCGETSSGSDGSGNSGAKAGDASATTAKVRGTLKPSLFISGDKEARQLLKSSDVWCRWNDGEVEIGTTFTNGLAAHITVHIQPNYRLKRAGLHGDGIDSDKDIGLDADQTRVWSEKIGNPDGVSGQPKITKCAPEINTVELG